MKRTFGRKSVLITNNMEINFNKLLYNKFTFLLIWSAYTILEFLPIVIPFILLFNLSGELNSTVLALIISILLFVCALAYIKIIDVLSDIIHNYTCVYSVIENLSSDKTIKLHVKDLKSLEHMLCRISNDKMVHKLGAELLLDMVDWYTVTDTSSNDFNLYFKLYTDKNKINIYIESDK